jgi:hypothetical protein
VFEGVWKVVMQASLIDGQVEDMLGMLGHVVERMCDGVDCGECEGYEYRLNMRMLAMGGGVSGKSLGEG